MKKYSESDFEIAGQLIIDVYVNNCKVAPKAVKIHLHHIDMYSGVNKKEMLLVMAMVNALIADGSADAN